MLKNVYCKKKKHGYVRRIKIKYVHLHHDYENKRLL